MPKRRLGAWIPTFMCFALMGSLSAQLSATAARKRSDVVKVNVRQCIQLPHEQGGWLDSEWQPFLPYVHSCKVVWQKSPPVYILSIWSDEFEATLPKDAPAEKLPKPLIASSNGKILGRLPDNFPLDPPRSIDVSFSCWSKGFPRRVRVDVTDPTVVGNHVIVLEWNPEDQAYVRKTARK